MQVCQWALFATLFLSMVFTSLCGGASAKDVSRAVEETVVTHQEGGAGGHLPDEPAGIVRIICPPAAQSAQPSSIGAATFSLQTPRCAPAPRWWYPCHLAEASTLRSSPAIRRPTRHALANAADSRSCAGIFEAAGPFRWSFNGDRRLSRRLRRQLCTADRRIRLWREPNADQQQPTCKEVVVGGNYNSACRAALCSTKAGPSSGFYRERCLLHCKMRLLRSRL